MQLGVGSMSLMLLLDGTLIESFPYRPRRPGAVKRRSRFPI